MYELLPLVFEQHLASVRVHLQRLVIKGGGQRSPWCRRWLLTASLRDRLRRHAWERAAGDIGGPADSCSGGGRAGAGNGSLPLHYLADSEAAALQLLASAPATAGVRDAHGRLPFASLLEDEWVEAAHAALPATETHAALAALAASISNTGRVALPLVTDVVGKRPLSGAGWELVPRPCRRGL